MICLNAFLAAHQEIQCVFPSVTELNLRVLMTVHVTQTVLRDAHAPPNKVKRDGSTRHTVVCLKSGLACVRIFGKSPDFLEKSCF